MTYEELGEKVKQKYPEYKSIDSSELGLKTASKYPEYKSMITETKKEEKVAGLYDKETLARKFIPQFTKGLEEGLPLGKQAVMGDIPRQVSEGMPEPKGLVGTTGRVVGKYAAPIVSAIGYGGLAEQAAGKFIPGLAGASFIPRVGRSAIGSAVGAQPFEYKSPQERAMMTGASAVAGPVIGETIGLGIKGIKLAPGAVKSLFKSGKDLKRASSYGEKITESIENLKDALPSAKEALKDASIDDAVRYKKALRPISKENSKIYREGLKQAEVSAKLTQSKVSDVIERSVQEAIDQGIPENSPLLTEMRNMINEIKPGTKTKFDWQTLGDVPDTTDEKLTIEQLRNIKSRLFKVADKSQDHADEIANAIFMRNYGDEIASQSPGFQAMQTEYAPYVEAKKWAYRVFKPFTKDEIPNGNRILKRVASGNANAEDFAYLERLESGSGRFKGTGNLRGSSTSMAVKLKDAAEEIKELRRIKTKNSAEVKRLENLVKWRDRVVVSGLTTLGALGAAKGYNLVKDYQK